MNRIPFDSSLEGTESCPRCGALTGESHLIGCMAEECPKCGNLLATCDCRVFLAGDKALAVRRLFNSIDNHVAAWAFAACFSRKSLLGLAGWLWASLNSDPEMIQAMALTEAGALASIKPSFCDATGKPRYSVRDITRALGCGKSEVSEMEKAFVGVETMRKANPLLWVQ